MKEIDIPMEWARNLPDEQIIRGVMEPRYKKLGVKLGLEGDSRGARSGIIDPKLKSAIDFIQFKRRIFS